MPLLEYRDFLETLSRLALTNPFSPDWVKMEKEALGSEFQRAGTVHLWSEESVREHPNLVRLTERTEVLAKELLGKFKAGEKPSHDERLLYQHLIFHLLYRRHRGGFDKLITARDHSTAGKLWQKFLADFEEFFPVSELRPLTELSSEHVFAWFFQVRRAFRHIFDYIVGSSESVIRLRAQAWNSIFTHDIQSYSERLYKRMNEFNTLITGDSGTGKELVARAIGMSQYIPFDGDKEEFVADFTKSFHAVNLAGMPANLIESELFGHVAGAFTGATQDKKGWLERKYDSDALFLDEIGELDHSPQVKLLRAIATRKFSRVGDLELLEWKGKAIAATNRDLAKDDHEGRFREDLYYRLCGDVIVTPSLRTQLDESPDDLSGLVQFATRQVVGDGSETVAETVEDWISQNMPNYAWPGNFRELEQCVRNVLIRGEYHPAESTRHVKFDSIEDAVAVLVKKGLSAEEVLRVYCGMVYEQTGRQYEAAAKITGQCGRTVKRYVDSHATTKQHFSRSGPPRKPK